MIRYISNIKTLLNKYKLIAFSLLLHIRRGTNGGESSARQADCLFPRTFQHDAAAAGSYWPRRREGGKRSGCEVVIAKHHLLASNADSHTTVNDANLDPYRWNVTQAEKKVENKREY